MWSKKLKQERLAEQIQQRACLGAESDLIRIVSAIQNKALKEELEKYFHASFSEGKY
jgi:hypothetical protein